MVLPPSCTHCELHWHTAPRSNPLKLECVPPYIFNHTTVLPRFSQFMPPSKLRQQTIKAPPPQARCFNPKFVLVWYMQQSSSQKLHTILLLEKLHTRTNSIIIITHITWLEPSLPLPLLLLPNWWHWASTPTNFGHANFRNESVQWTKSYTHKYIHAQTRGVTVWGEYILALWKSIGDPTTHHTSHHISYKQVNHQHQINMNIKNVPLTKPPSLNANSLNFHKSTTGSDKTRRISSALLFIVW